MPAKDDEQQKKKKQKRKKEEEEVAPPAPTPARVKLAPPPSSSSSIVDAARHRRKVVSERTVRIRHLPMEGISDRRFRIYALRHGLEKLSKHSIAEARLVIGEFVTRLMEDAATLCENSRAQRLQPYALLEAYSRLRRREIYPAYADDGENVQEKQRALFSAMERVSAKPVRAKKAAAAAAAPSS
jgi:hypothetical protein